MKICILGLDGAVPQVLFQDERLANIRRLMELGAYGPLQGVLPPGSIPGWLCLAASQDPGSLGLYSAHGRSYRGYSSSLVAPPPIQGSAIWDQVSAAGRKSILAAVPPNFPPRPIPGVSLGCFLTPQPLADDFILPASLKESVRALAGSYVADVRPSRNLDRLRDQIFEMSRKQWEVVRWLICQQEWDYFHFVDIGLDRVQSAFWPYFDPRHPRYEPGSPFREIIPAYCLWLDEQIGSVLDLLDAETVLLLASTSGMRRLDGAFAVNQWLLQEGYLALRQPPAAGVTAIGQLNVNWARTRAWSDDGPCARIYFNLAGREPQGIVPAGDCEAFRNEITAKLQSLSGPGGCPLSAKVFQPGQAYRSARNVPPDLIVQFEEGRWSALGGVGYPALCVQENIDGCHPGAPGIFVLTAPNSPLSGEFAGAHLLDMAPTLLDLAGYSIPASMQGRSLVAGLEKKSGGSGPDGEQIILDRLAGLGYV